MIDEKTLKVLGALKRGKSVRFSDLLAVTGNPRTLSLKLNLIKRIERILL